MSSSSTRGRSAVPGAASLRGRLGGGAIVRNRMRVLWRCHVRVVQRGDRRRWCRCRSDRPSRFTRQSEIDLALDITPLLARAKLTGQLVEGPAMLGRKLEPREEIEWSTELAAVEKPARDRR